MLNEYKNTVHDTFGNYTYNDNRPEVIEGQYQTFFELSGTNREGFTVEILSLDKDINLVWKFASQGNDLLNRLFGSDANTNRAMLSLMYAEQGKAPDLLEACLAIVHSSGDAIWNLYDVHAKPVYGDTRTSFEKQLNEITNSGITKLMGQLQGVNIEELLYKELLKMTLDASYSYYTGLLK